MRPQHRIGVGLVLGPAGQRLANSSVMRFMENRDRRRFLRFFQKSGSAVPSHEGNRETVDGAKGDRRFFALRV